jgi:hypothetical protein
MNLTSILRGMAKSLDLFGVMGRHRAQENFSPAEQARRDAEALASDWIIVGQHLWVATGSMPERQSEPVPRSSGTHG